MCCGSGGGGWASTSAAPASGGWASPVMAPDGPWIYTAMDGTTVEVDTYAEAAALARPGPGRAGGGGITRKPA